MAAAAASLRPLIASYVGATTGNADTKTPSATLPVGAGEWLVVAWVGHGGSAGVADSMTINGVAVAAADMWVNRALFAMARIPHPGGSTCTFALSLSSVVNRHGFFSWAVDGDWGNPFSAPIDVGSGTNSTAIDAAAGGVLFGLGLDSNASGNAWTAGIGHDAALNLEGGAAGAIGGHTNNASLVTNLSCTASVNYAILVGSWR